ncbi:MAG: oxygenase MpaB family protein [Mycobacteriales bacterium]
MNGIALRDAPDAVRARLGAALRQRIAGDDADRRTAAIWDAEGPRRFGPTDPIWRVHADASMFIGGIRALLLQSLHPLAMAGVAGHSGYKGDPWGRLQRTSYYLAATTYGSDRVAGEAIDRVQRIHRHVRGRSEDGRPYAAGDPHLLGWVHAAEADSFLRAHRRFGADALTDAEADRYVEQIGQVAARLGVLDPPRTVADLDQAVRAYRPELHSTPAAREAARLLLLRPPLPVLARPGYGGLAAGAVSLLPMWARLMLRIPWLWPVSDALARPAAAGTTGVLRWAMSHPHVDPHSRTASG